MADAVFLSVVLLRFFVPLLIPRFPLPAVVACLVIDAADQTIFQAFTDDPLEGYQAYDKALDVYYLAIAYCSSMRNWRDPVAFSAARGLYLYRLVGVTLFELLHWRWLLLAFPNTFEYFFIAYEAVRTRWNPLRLTAAAVFGMVVAIWVFVKLPQEFWIHIAKMDFTEFMSDHPWMWGVLLAVAAVAAFAGWRNRGRVPAPDWRFTVDVNRTVPELSVATGSRRVFDLLLLEKVVFIALVSVIFAQILPDIRSSNLGIAIGVSALVVVNAAVSEWFRRRGRMWTTTLESFGAMLAINVGIVFVDAVLGRGGDDTPTLNTLFFVLLLSLLIAMFDLMRSTRGDDDLRTPMIPAVLAARRQRLAAGS